jgi:hypothetical protein
MLPDFLLFLEPYASLGVGAKSGALSPAILESHKQRGRVILQSRVQIGTSQQRIRVFVDVDVSPAQVVTAYRTSKIDKYWSKQ